MQRGGKLRYVNEATGTFVIISVLLALTGLFFIAGAQRWFSPEKQLLILLPEEGAHGLREEADVEILGTVAGQVRQIYINPQGRMVAELRLDPDFYQFVRSDSKVTIRHAISLVGGLFLEIGRGTGAELPIGTPVLIATAEKDLKTVITEILASVESATLPTLQEYTKLAVELRAPDGPIQTLLAKMNRIASNLEQGSGTLPMLLNDQALAKDILGTVDSLNATLDQLQNVLQTAEFTGSKLGKAADDFGQYLQPLPGLMKQTDEVLGNLKQASKHLPAMTRGVNEELTELPGLLLQTKSTLHQIERLTLGLQRHWMIRGYVEPETRPLRIPYEEIGGERQQP
jgi:ABC-type transporter Mla subunit MlaD